LTPSANTQFNESATDLFVSGDQRSSGSGHPQRTCCCARSGCIGILDDDQLSEPVAIPVRFVRQLRTTSEDRYQSSEGLPINVVPTALPPNCSFCPMASRPLQTTRTTGFAFGSAFDRINVYLCSVIFASIRHQLILPPSVFRLPSSTFCYLSRASSTFLQFNPCPPFETVVGKHNVPDGRDVTTEYRLRA
jgi:hypothetical protein